MKAVLMSIHPKWCELIFSGEKTIEVRKTAPKMETPFKVYVYQTKHKGKSIVSEALNTVYGGGKVVGEFVCNKVERLPAFFERTDGTCLTVKELDKYGSNRKGELFYWHISDLKIYDTPKELSEFRMPCPHEAMPCWICPSCDLDKDYYNLMQCLSTISRPPQSWQYVEEVAE